MRLIIVPLTLVLGAATPAAAIEFLGVELCADRVDTGVILPADSPLSLESVEVGRHGGLVLLLHSKKGKVLGQVDDLMAGFVGDRGTGDERKLEWSSDEITAFAQVIQKGYVALAVTAAEGCTVEPEAAPAAAAVESEPTLAAEPTQESAPEPARVEELAASTAAAVAASEVETAPEEPAPEVDAPEVDAPPPAP